MTTRRHEQHTAVSYPHKIRGDVVLHVCGLCRDFIFPKCGLTGEDILYPHSGPVGYSCPLPDYIFPEEETAHA